MSRGYIADAHVRGRSIYLVDLLAPGTRPIISDRTAEDCEVRGPVVVCLEATTIEGCEFDCSIESLFIEVAISRVVSGVVMLRRCTFRRCRFTQVGIIGTSKQMEQVRKGFAQAATPAWEKFLLELGGGTHEDGSK